MDLSKSFFDSYSNRILIALIVVDILLITLLISLPVTLAKIMTDDGYKVLWQVALITIGGGFVSIAFAELKKEQESRKVARDYFKTVFSRSLKEYNTAKKCRRLLRAKATYKENDEVYLRPVEYDKLMTKLEDCQLEFESLKREMIQNKNDKNFLFQNKCQSLESYFCKMEEYLAHILSEFEKNNFNKEDNVKLSSMPHLEEFIKSKGSSVKVKKTLKFQDDFSNIFDEVTKTLVEEISK